MFDLFGFPIGFVVVISVHLLVCTMDSSAIDDGTISSMLGSEWGGASEGGTQVGDISSAVFDSKERIH